MGKGAGVNRIDDVGSFYDTGQNYLLIGDDNFLLYPSSVKMSLKLLSCDVMIHPGDDNDNFDLYRSFLKIDHQVECYSPIHMNTLLSLTLPFTILITFGVPGIMGYVIHRLMQSCSRDVGV